MRKLQIVEARAKPVQNPSKPAEGNRKTFVLTFDWGEDATAGMLDALRSAGFYSTTADRYPRTTIIVRAAKATKDTAVLNVVAGNLQDNGSAMVARVGGDIYVWPDTPWEKGEEKIWKTVLP